MYNLIFKVFIKIYEYILILEYLASQSVINKFSIFLEKDINTKENIDPVVDISKF